MTTVIDDEVERLAAELAELEGQLSIEETRIEVAARARDEETNANRSLRSRRSTPMHDAQTHELIVPPEWAQEDAAYEERMAEHGQAIVAANRARRELRQRIESVQGRLRQARRRADVAERTVDASPLAAAIVIADTKLHELLSEQAALEDRVDVAVSSGNGAEFVGAQLRGRQLPVEIAGARLEVLELQRRHADAMVCSLAPALDDATAAVEAAAERVAHAEAAHRDAANALRQLNLERDRWRQEVRVAEQAAAQLVDAQRELARAG